MLIALMLIVCWVPAQAYIEAGMCPVALQGDHAYAVCIPSPRSVICCCGSGSSVLSRAVDASRHVYLSCSSRLVTCKLRLWLWIVCACQGALRMG
jgi:hypothetical protein